MPRKVLDNVEFSPGWDNFSGMLTDILNHLGAGFEPFEVPGRSGYAFRITMHEIACPSGPQISDWTVNFPAALARSGFSGEYFHGWANEPGYEEKIKEAIAACRDSIGRDVPAIIYAPGVLLEFGVIIGDDGDGEKFIAKGITAPGRFEQMEIPYDKFGGNELGLLSVLVVGERLDDFNRDSAVRAGLISAWEHLEGREWQHPSGKYGHGIAAFDKWINALANRREEISAFGHSLCAHTYANARTHAVEYLGAYPDILGDAGAYRRLVGNYTASRNALIEIAEMLPFPEGAYLSEERAEKIINHLRVAKEKEIDAHSVLGRILGLT
ncbi:MAG: histone H1/H5 family protein [Planctomycetota bacterium]|jgi:hypothetical protein